MSETEIKNFYVQLGKRIHDLRKKEGLTQEVFAEEMLGLSRVSLVNIEKGRQRPSIHLLFDISFFLKVSVGEIISPFEHRISKNSSEITTNWKKAIDKSTKGNFDSNKKLLKFAKEISSKQVLND